VPTHPRAVAPLPLAAAIVALAIAAFAAAQTPDVATIQAREARNADTRTLAAFDRFRQALAVRYPGDPRLTMLEFGESEATALVLTSPASPRVRDLARRPLDRHREPEAEPWARPDVAAANAFPLRRFARPRSARGRTRGGESPDRRPTSS
jgi:hypothetical protein